MTVHIDFDKHNLYDSVKLLHDRLVNQQLIEIKAGKDTLEGLVSYFRNKCIELQEDPNNEFFKNTDRNGNENEKSKENESTAKKVLRLAEEQCSELFIDQFGISHGAIEIAGHIEILPLKSARFRNWLCRIYYNSEGDVLNSETVTNVLNVLKSRAEFDGTVRDLSVRLATNVDEEPFTIYYDLTNKDWRAIKITKDGWNVQYAHIILKRYNNQQPQVYPSKPKEYPPDIFDRLMRLVNIKDEDNQLLLKCYIVSLFYPEIPKPVLMLHGEQGSAKSTLQELIKMLVDPSSIRTLTFPRDINELVQKLSHNYIAYFDNISIIPDWISDQLCRAVTGSGFSKRELYTDDDDIIINFKRCIGFNGINLGATKADLLDRGIIIELERISKEKQRKIEDIWTEFETIKPQLLSHIFDILVKVLQVKSNGGIAAEIKGLPRMADFAEIGEIISRCMGYDYNRFLEAYYKNIDLQIEEAISANPVANVVVKLMEDRLEWKGTATDLLSNLEPIANTLKINTNYKSWPKSASMLSRRLNEARTNLREIGIIIDRYVIDQKTKTRGIRICKIPSEPSVLSETENHAQISDYVSDDIIENQTIVSSDDKIPSDQFPQNRAQNSISDDTDDTDDTLHALQASRPNNYVQLKHNTYWSSGKWYCRDCKTSGDKFHMENTNCSDSKK
jgi:hypothetical protein